jgi:hypothetical protein
MSKKRAKALALRDSPRHITEEQYALAWRLIQGGATEQEIREACTLSPKQTHWLLNVGDASRGMEALRPALRKAQSEIRAEMLNRARSVANVGLKAIERQLQNSANASALVGQLLVKIRESIAEEKEPEAWVGRMLEQLRHHTDTSKAAVAFRTLFGDHAGQAGMPSENSPGLNGRRPAALEAADGEDATGLALAQHMATWSEEELDHFIATGEEPVIDTEAKEK